MYTCRVASSQLRDAEAMIHRNKILQRALQRSDYVNDMLLIREREEMQKIDGMAEDLIMREQSIHRKARPCLQESAECLQCFMENPNDPTLCEDLTDSYLRCAHAASESNVHSVEASRIEKIR